MQKKNENIERVLYFIARAVVKCQFNFFLDLPVVRLITNHELIFFFRVSIWLTDLPLLHALLSPIQMAEQTSFSFSELFWFALRLTITVSQSACNSFARDLITILSALQTMLPIWERCWCTLMSTWRSGIADYFVTQGWCYILFLYIHIWFFTLNMCRYALLI